MNKGASEQRDFDFAFVSYYTTIRFYESTFDMGLPSAAREGLHSAPGSERPAGLYGYWIYYNRNGSVSFGTETREYFGILPAEIAGAVPESATALPA
jgi:hypothetical protein